MKYRNLGGEHTTLEGLVVKHGKVFECDDPDLRKKFPNKFELVTNEPQALPKKEAKKTETKKTETTTDGLADVTADFPSAEEAGLTVKRDKRGWWVYDDDDEAINEKPLKKKDVNDTVEEYLAE